MIDRITRLDRRIGLVVVVLVVVSVMGVVSWMVTSGLGGEADEASASASGSGGDSFPEELGPDGEPIPRATLVARAVAATLQAMPTPTPVPTPDIAATLQADLDANRREVQPVLELNPLDVEEGSRNPYLTPTELRYFRELGPRLWAYTDVWLELQRILAKDVGEWNDDFVSEGLSRARLLLESAPDRPRLTSTSRDDRIDPLVRAYADSIESGMTGVREAVTRLSDAEDILLSGEEVGHDQREELLRIVREVEGLLAPFDHSMSSYGCSVCGELFRREVEE